MDLATLLSVVQTIITALQLTRVRNICSFLGYTSELDDLQRTIIKVQCVLLDADAIFDENLSEQDKGYIEDLRDAIYDADDLLDKFVTLAEHKHMKLFKEGRSKFLEKAHRFFSSIKQLDVVYRMSKGVKEITKKLDTIADIHKKFAFRLDSSQPISNKWKEETGSFEYVEDIIGRNDDKKKIVGTLLDPNVRPEVSFLSIVGMGGLGKTTLARLIYNDERITNEFPKRHWVCVGDHDHNHLDVKATLAMILRSITPGFKHEELSFDELQCQVREQLVGKKYLLILDDVWNENRDDWLKLENILKGDPSGSWVVLTTRSHNTAQIVGGESPYELKGLSDDNSWFLFERLAFKPKEGETKPPDHLVEIGKKILKKCANVPLAIRVAGTLLYGEGEDKWSSFEKNELLKVSPEKNGILPILKFSYHQLSFPLKSCFNYCALFPKDYELEKEKLIHLWMAQGYIVPLEGQSLEEAGEEYFLILLRRCFFQDVEKDEFETITFKLHDLMHDVAEQVSTNEIRVVDNITGDLDKKIRHLSVADGTGTVGSFTQSRVRTLLYLYLRWERKGLYVGTLLDKWMCLRALDLKDSNIISLPNEIGKLVHLRYLDLSRNEKMEVLPKSLTRLHNLETLILRACTDLIKLPTDIYKLVKLRCLDIVHCNRITHMPADMGKLSCLHKLTMYAVDLGNPRWGNQWEGLQILTKLRGDLKINIKLSENSTYEKGNSGKLNEYIMNKPHLEEITFSFMLEGAEGGKGYEEALMEDMQPHPKLRRLSLVWYKGEKLPSWARGVKLATSLSNLEKIVLRNCNGLQYLPPLGKLRRLRWLELDGLTNLEYIVENRENNNVVEECFFFQSLKALELMDLERLKGWWREEEEGVSDNDHDHDEEEEYNVSRSRRRQPQLSFPHLSSLFIYQCPELPLILTLPDVEQVRLSGVNEKLRVTSFGSNNSSYANASACPSQNSLDVGGNISMSRIVTTENVRCVESLLSITKLIIEYDKKVERLEDVREMWRSYCCSSLRILRIRNCSNLKSVVKGGLAHLTALEVLQISDCPSVTLNINDAEGDGDGVGTHITASSSSSSCPPFVILPTLHSLHLESLPKVVNLPEWMQHLTSLHSLQIWGCKALESLPKWMPHLPSLTHFEIYKCSEVLKRRCSESPPGQDWPKIHHIPHLSIE